MRRFEAIGVIELQYYTVAVEVLDHVCKATAVEFLTSENYLGGKLVTLIVGGSVSDVTEAIQVARMVCQNKQDNPLKMAIAITNPHLEIMKYIVATEKSEAPVAENGKQPSAKTADARKRKLTTKTTEEE